MKKVVLLGDSIRLIGYGASVAELLKDEYEVWQPEDNCRYAQYTLRGLFEWAEGIKNADIIHWNNGMWDVSDLYGDGPFTPIERYEELMLRLCRLLKQRCGKLIFATTTPVYEPYAYQDNSRIRMYNERIVPLLQKEGCIINDLYSLVSQDIPGNIREDDRLHLTPKGIERAAAQVTDAIRKADKGE